MGEELKVTSGRFAILTHDHPFRHWDLLLEVGPVARTWRLLDEPGSGRTVRAEAIADHRLLYLDYEGEVSGGRGHVSRWDAGDYRTLEQNESQWRVELHGAKLRGEVSCQMTQVVFSPSQQ